MITIDNKAAAAAAVRARSYALRFSPNVPIEMIDACVRKANDALTRQIPGAARFFNLSLKEETINGEPVLASYLHADETGWAKFRTLGDRLLPEAISGHRERLVAWPVPLDGARAAQAAHA